MRVRPAVLILLLLGLVPSLANALALGEITLNSGLNEALDAEIQILSATPEEIQNLTATVASRETFERYGLDRPEFLSGLRFQVARSGSRDILRVGSTRPISEPFVTFLVEAQWRRGRLLREYTVLLDPPIFLPTPEKAAPAPAVVAPRSVRSQSQPDRGQIVRDLPPRPPPSRTQRYSGTPAYGDNYGPIVRNETLWSIAARLRTDNSITMNQMMIAIYEANQGQFLGNINLMKEGSVLRIPDRATIESVAQPQAYAMAVAHNQAWRAGRPSQVPSKATVAGTAPSRISTTPDSSRLRLVEPDEVRQGPGSDVSSGPGSGADAAAVETLARNEANIARLTGENDQLRSDLEEIRRLLNLRDGSLAELQNQLGSDKGPAVSPQVTATTTPDTAQITNPATGQTDGQVATTPATGTQTGADTGTQAGTDAGPEVPSQTGTETVSEKTPAVLVPPVVTTLPDEPGFVARAIDTVKGAFSNLWVLIGLGVMALGAFGLMALRGRDTEGQDAIEALTREARDSAPDTVITPRITLPAAPDSSDVEFFDDSGTFKPVDFSAAQAIDSASGEYPFEDTVGGEIKLDQSDPLAEADFHMAYGLYDQASDLVKKAVSREPGRIDLRMKLLEIFFVWGNESEFRSTAQDLRTNMSEEIAGEWDKIAIMGKQICPNDDLFAGGSTMGASADIDLEFEPTGAQASVDLDTGGKPIPVDSGIDLDIFGALDAGNTSGDAAGALDTVNEMLDFDLGDDDPLLDEDDDTRPEPVERIKDQIRARLSSTDTDETAEMDLSDLGVDLDLAGGSAEMPTGSAADSTAESEFGDIFDAPASQASETSELPSITTELTAAGNALDLDIGDIFGDLDTEDDEETARDLAALEESMEQTGSQVDETGDTGHFSAEVETLHGDSLDVDISSFDDDEGRKTRLIAPEDATGTPNEDAFSTSIFGGDFSETGAHAEDTFSTAIFGDDDSDETKMLGPHDEVTGSHTEDAFSSAIFGEDETVQVPASDGAGDNGVDLDIGDSLSDLDDGGTTAKVATSELALPGSDDELSEVGTKLDLARAYMDMGDPAGARGILEEVLVEGNEGQQADARQMLSSLS